MLQAEIISFSDSVALHIHLCIRFLKTPGQVGTPSHADAVKRLEGEERVSEKNEPERGRSGDSEGMYCTRTKIDSWLSLPWW